MWTLLIVFMSPYVGTATTVEFYNKKACFEAKTVVEDSVKSERIQIKAACIYQGE
jgi:hypothetical protein